LNAKSAFKGDPSIAYLFVADSEWRETLKALMQLSRAIAFAKPRCGPTPGVSFELDKITGTPELREKTLLVDASWQQDYSMSPIVSYYKWQSSQWLFIEDTKAEQLMKNLLRTDLQSQSLLTDS
jgi:hypothetical protein